MNKAFFVLIMILAFTGSGIAEEKLSPEKKEVTGEVTYKITKTYSDGREKEKIYNISNNKIIVTYGEGDGILVCAQDEYESSRDYVVKLLRAKILAIDTYTHIDWKLFTNCLTFLKDGSIIKNDAKALKALIDFSIKADGASGEVLNGIITVISYKNPKMFLELLLQFDDQYKDIIVNNCIYPRELNEKKGDLVNIIIKKEEFMNKWINYVATTSGDLKILGQRIIDTVKKQK